MILTQSIPQDQWLPYFNALSLRFQGWDVTIDVLSLGLGNQPAAESLALQGFSFEARGTEQGDIFIEVGNEGDELLIHHVDDPQCVRFAELLPGLEADLQIESLDGTTTLVHLRRHCALPPGEA